MIDVAVKKNYKKITFFDNNIVEKPAWTIGEIRREIKLRKQYNRLKRNASNINERKQYGS